MNIALAHLTLNDLTLQWRYRIIAAYIVVIGIYCAILIAAGALVPGWVVAALVYSDPAVLGYFFLGGLMMLEKSENVRAALSMSPMSPAQYLAAKSASLTFIALIAVVVLSLVSRTHLGNIWLVLFVTASTSIMYIALGAVMALRFKTVNAYLIGAVPILIPLNAPLLLMLVNPLPDIAYLIPPLAQFKLLLVGFNASVITPAGFLMALVSTFGGAVLSFWAAARYLQREFGAK
ncbi:fluoroquinolone export ABC transporter permease subunit [Maritalea sp.]|uniref:fluoroquinolone export ABC transporter permease subunit n=1 Tax=Maritalea sp. TaxID=2003361 RepID=UPI003EF4E167